MKLNSIKQVIKGDFCLGCGLCSVVHPGVKVDEINGRFQSSFRNDSEAKDHIAICPGAGYDIYTLGKRYHNATHYSYELGWYNSLHLAHSTDEEIMIHASSGGMITAIAMYMLEQKLADGVICSRYVYSGSKVRPQTFIASNKEELLSAQGSKYCPTKTLEILDKLDSDKKYVLIGTPCQIAGWRLFHTGSENQSNNIVLTIANFCGGYRDFREMDYFVTRKARFSEVKYFQHRGDGVPGQMRIVNNNDESWTYPYPDYGKLSPILKNNRCVYCVDATGELADISCGDAWLDRVKSLSGRWSCIITRNSLAERVIFKMLESNLVEVADILEQEVIKSQLNNITSKKYRQVKRMRIQSILLHRLPSWGSGLKDMGGSYFNEIKILVSKWRFRRKNKL